MVEYYCMEIMDEVYHSDKTPVATCLFTGLFFTKWRPNSPMDCFSWGILSFQKVVSTFKYQVFYSLNIFSETFLHLNGHQFELEIFNGNKPQKLEGGEDG